MLCTFSLIILLGSFSRAAANLETRGACSPFGDKELPLQRDYKFLNSKSDIESAFKKIYSSDRRLLDRAYWDASAKSIVIPYSSHTARIPSAFWEGVANHISKALKNEYANGVIYADLGHMHILVPEKIWADIKSTSTDAVMRMEKALAAPETKALYHTAEMVQIKEGDFAKGAFPQDPWKLWRYFSRNLFGSFTGEKNVEVLWAGEKAIYNTVRSLPNFTEVTTLYFSANHNGCFSYTENSEEKYFDMTFQTIPYENPSAREPSSKARAPKHDFH